MTAQRDAGSGSVLAEIRGSLLALSPAERIVLQQHFGIGDVAGLAGMRRVGSLSDGERLGIRRGALRKLRNLSGVELDSRDDSWQRRRDRKQPEPAWPGWGGGLNIVPPNDRLPPEPDDESVPELWDEV